MWDKLELRLKSLKAYRNYLGKEKVMLCQKIKMLNTHVDIKMILMMKL